MTTVFENIALSLDGYMAPEGMAIEHWDTPEYKNWGVKWGALMRWIFNQQACEVALAAQIAADRDDGDAGPGSGGRAV